jgi:hypothetical protein
LVISRIVFARGRMLCLPPMACMMLLAALGRAERRR